MFLIRSQAHFHGATVFHVLNNELVPFYFDQFY
jgi:hypothetical protein